ALPLWPVHPCPYRSRSTVVRVLPCQVLPFTVDEPVGAPCAGLQWMVGPGARPGRWIPYRRCGWGGTNLLQSVPLARCASGPSPRQANHTSASYARNRVTPGARPALSRPPLELPAACCGLGPMTRAVPTPLQMIRRLQRRRFGRDFGAHAAGAGFPAPEDPPDHQEGGCEAGEAEAGGADQG